MLRASITRIMRASIKQVKACFAGTRLEFLFLHVERLFSACNRINCKVSHHARENYFELLYVQDEGAEMPLNTSER